MIKGNEMNDTEMNDLLKQIFPGLFEEGAYSKTVTGKPKVEKSSVAKTNYDSQILEDGSNEIVINAAGIKPEDISIEVTEGKLAIKSKNLLGFMIDKFDLEFNLGETLDGEKIEATHELGLLTLTIPLKEVKKPKVTKIEIK